MIFVLDACAMISWLRDEPGADVVDRAIRDVNSKCFAHGINLCEVFYEALRRTDESKAQSVLADLEVVGVNTRNDFDDKFWLEAGRMKAAHRASLADCFAVALTKRVGGTLLTSDHRELDPLAALGVCPISFIR